MTVQIYIPDNKELYAKLHGRSGEIEAELGMKLEWHELPKKKASRIIARRSGDIHDPTQVDELVSWMVTTADRFVQVFPGFLQS